MFLAIAGVAVLSLGSASRGIEPTGSKVGVVQFDAIIELNSVSHGSHVLLFARYWVSPEFYCVGVVWAEPHGTGLDISFYPPSLVIVSDDGQFSISHDVKPEYGTACRKPLPERGVFRFMYGDYPIQNLQFVEQEVSRTRIRVSDLGDLDLSGGGVEQSLNYSVEKNQTDVNGLASRLGVRTQDGRIDSLRFLDSQGRVLKSLDYEYAQTHARTYLVREHVQLPERQVVVGLQGDQAIVTKVRDQQYEYSQFETIHHEGGRKCTIEYAPASLGGKEVVVPVETTVCDGQGTEVLRSARMMNFRRIELDANAVREAASRFCCFTDEHRQYRDLLVKYWEKPPVEVIVPDVNTIAHLRSCFEDSLARQESLGGQLKHANMLMELDRMVGDTPNLTRHYRRYLSILSDNNLNRMVQVGGYNAIEQLMSWGRYSDADVLLEHWTGVLLPAFDSREELLRFCAQELRNRRPWTTNRLLERALGVFGQSAAARFEIQTMRCQALHQLGLFVRDYADDAPKDLLAQSQWAIGSVGRDGLQTMVRGSLDEAIRAFGVLNQPTPAQTSLREVLDGIRQGIEAQMVTESGQVTMGNTTAD
jgi:hypothetical protein